MKDELCNCFNSPAASVVDFASNRLFGSLLLWIDSRQFSSGLYSWLRSSKAVCLSTQRVSHNGLIFFFRHPSLSASAMASSSFFWRFGKYLTHIRPESYFFFLFFFQKKYIMMNYWRNQILFFGKTWIFGIIGKIWSVSLNWRQPYKGTGFFNTKFIVLSCLY